MSSPSIQKIINMVKGSYSISFLIAKKVKSFSDGEFVKECLEAVVKDVLPDKSELFSCLCLNRETVCNQINDISNEIIIKLHDRIRDFKYFSIAINVSTDVSDTAQLVVFVRGVNESFQITEELLTLISLKDTLKGDDIFCDIENCLRENHLGLEILCGISTDGAPSMIDKEKGAIKLLTNKIESNKKSNDYKRDDLIIVHCLIYQQNLCAQVLSMNHVMQVVVKTVNYIRTHALPHRKFKDFLEELDSEYGDVVYFSHGRYLSRGRCLRRFYELRQEIDLLMNDKQISVPELRNDEWLLDLSFLIDIVEKLNQLNISLQGKNNLIIDTFYHIKAFQKKLLLFEYQLKNNNTQHFPLLRESKNSKCNNYLKYAKEIRKLISTFESRFSNLDKYNKIFEIYSSPFHVDVESAPECLQMELIDLQCNNELKHIFETSESKIDFYNVHVTKVKFPNLRKLAQKIVSAYGSTYTCESFFSRMKSAKHKSSLNLTDENFQHQLRCANTRIEIDLQKLSEKKFKNQIYPVIK